MSTSEAANPFHGHRTILRQESGLHVSRVAHPPSQCIQPHEHDWPCVTLYRCGSYVEELEGRTVAINGPGFVLHPAKAAHSNRIGAWGLDTVSVMFDPDLLPAQLRAPTARGLCSTNGRGARAASLAADRLLRRDSDAVGILLHLFRLSLSAGPSVNPPRWLPRVAEEVERGASSTWHLAQRLGLHPAWLARAYLRGTGESIQSTMRRRKAEQALKAIRTSKESFAVIAADAGFCDQSHMVRVFQSLLGTTPTALRAAAFDSSAGQS